MRKHHVHLINTVRFPEKEKIMFRKALIAFSLMLVSGVLFYDSAYTHSGDVPLYSFSCSPTY